MARWYLRGRPWTWDVRPSSIEQLRKTVDAMDPAKVYEAEFQDIFAQIIDLSRGKDQAFLDTENLLHQSGWGGWSALSSGVNGYIQKLSRLVIMRRLLELTNLDVVAEHILSNEVDRIFPLPQPKQPKQSVISSQKQLQDHLFNQSAKENGHAGKRQIAIGKDGKPTTERQRS